MAVGRASSPAPHDPAGEGHQPAVDRDARMWRVLVGLYPPSWRSRYRDEMLALLADTRGDAHRPGRATRIRTALSLVAGAVRTWIRPPVHLYAAAGRVRTSVIVLLASWVLLAAVGLVFGQLNDEQSKATVTPGHPITGRLFAFYVVAAHLSVAVLVLLATPLWFVLLRTTVRRRDRGRILLATTPVIVPSGFLAVLVATSRAVRHGDAGIGAGWFVALTVLGGLAAAGAVVGPSLVLRTYAPTGRVLDLALYGVGGAVAIMAAAVAASAADLMAVRAWGSSSIVHAPTSVIAGYIGLLGAVLAVAIVSGARGARATLTR